MTTKVNADTSGGLKLTSDTSGTLELQSAGNTKLTVNSSGATIPTISGTTSMSAITGLASINSGQVGGRRNLLINGAQQVDQRNGGSGVTPNSVYITDRWKMQSQAGGSGAQITSTIAGFTKSLKYTGSENSSFLQLGQQIEYATYGHLAGSAITISFYAKANNTNGGSTALTVRTRSVTGVDGSALFAGSNSDTSVTISTTAARYTVSRTIPADSKGFSIEFVLGAHVNTDGFEITGIQAELGTVTAFEYTDIGTETDLCCRYFTKSGGDVYTGLLGFGIAGAAGAFRDSGFFPTLMRANPTMAYTNLGSGWSAANINSRLGGYTVELSKNTSDVRPKYRFTASADF